MMLASLLDVLNKRVKEKKPLGNGISLEGAVNEFLQLIPEAEKFDFGTIPTEFTNLEEFDKGNGNVLPTFRMPAITTEELDFWFDGLIPLPAPICWFEFRVSLDSSRNLDSTSGLLIRKDSEGKVWVQRCEFNKTDSANYVIDGTWTNLKDKERVVWENADKDRWAMLQRLSAEKQYDLFASSAMLVVYLTLMVNSRTTELRRMQPTAQQQSLRRQLRKSPLPEHTIVTIIPQRFIDEANEADGRVKGTHASPRIHWRRSHIRTYNRGLPNEYIKVIPRMIIGRRELGEVKHDYVVRMKTA